MMFKLKTLILGLVNFIMIGSMEAIFGFDEKIEGSDSWNPVSAGPVTTWTAPICDRGKFVVQPFFFYNRTRGTFDNLGHYKAFRDGEKKHQFQEQLFIQYGITDNLEIDGQTVYQQNYRHKDGDSAISTGFGDSYLFLRYCALEEKQWLPHTAVLSQVKFPTGKYQNLDSGKLGTDLMAATSGGGSYDHGYGINLTKHVKPFVLHLDFIYTIPIEAKVDGVKTRYGKYINYDFGVECFLPHGFNLMIEFNGFLQGDKKADGELVPASDINSLAMAPGIGWCPSENIQALIAYQRTLAGTNADVNDSFVFTFVHTF